MNRIIGIDLGTSTSEIAYLKEGKPFVIPNNRGETITPSVVGISETGQLVIGQEAKDQATLRPEHTAMEVKRLMGSKEKVKMGEKDYTPEEISSFILKHLKTYAENYLGEAVSQAVITVPAYFTDQQRKATIQAGKLAGLEVERIINEPTAAALTYGIDHMEEEEHILVYDLGGGTLDVTILEMFDGVLEVKASSGNNHLGGKDFDDRLIQYLVDDFDEKHQINLSKDMGALAKIKKEAEQCKIALSNQDNYQVSIPFIAHKEGNPVELEKNITKEEFENLIGDLIQSTREPIEMALEDAKLTPQDIQIVLLVGGSTRIPLVHRFLEATLGQAPQTLLDPDLAVTMGAAIQGGMLNDELSPESDLLITDVCPYTLGIEVLGSIGGILTPDVLDVIIPRNTTIPVWKEKTYYTAVEGQEAAEIVVYQGDIKKASLNHCLGKFILKGIPENEAGKENVKVRFTYDANGLLQVEGTIMSTGEKAEIVIDTMGIEMEEEVDINKWMEAPNARTYRALIKRAEKMLPKVEDEWEKQELEGILSSIKRALVLEAPQEELGELKEELEEFLYDLEL